MKRQVFSDEIAELTGHVSAIDAAIGVIAERIAYLEALKTRAVTVQGQMQAFADALAANETAIAAETMDACATHAAPVTSN